MSAAPKPEKPKDKTVEQTSSFSILRYLKIFRQFDVSGDGKVSPSELQDALEASGVELTMSEFRKFLAEVDTDGDQEISFLEFFELAKKLFPFHIRSKTRHVRIPRAYLNPEQYEHFSAIFRAEAGDDGDMQTSELADFFKKNQISVSAERLQGIMAEVDDDQSGTLGETEFLVLLVKAMAMKKRKVGPGQCSVDMLRKEGWSLIEMKRLGFECKDFIESGYPVEELLSLFSAADFCRAGLSCKDLVAAGWDCAKGREAGYQLKDFVDAGCSVQKMREAGFDDAESAKSLQRLGVDATQMRQGDWPLSELMQAGYSSTHLCIAGYSTVAISAVQNTVNKKRGTQERRNTFIVRKELEQSAVGDDG